VKQLENKRLPDDMIEIIVDQTAEQKPIVVSKEGSVYPAPSSETSGYQKGGWIIIGLKPEDQKGNAKGFLRFELHYTKLNGEKQKCAKEIDFTEAEKAIEEGKKKKLGIIRRNRKSDGTQTVCGWNERWIRYDRK